MKNKLSELKSSLYCWLYDMAPIILAIAVTFLLAAGLIVGTNRADERRQQMEESGKFSGNYQVVEKSIEYHGEEDSSDYLLILEEAGLFSSDKRYVVFVSQEDYYQYKEEERMTCSFERDEDTGIYTKLNVKESWRNDA